MAEQGKGLKLTYNAAHLRARLDATCGDLRLLASLPADIKERIQNRLNLEKKNGVIIDAATSFNLFQEFLERLKTPAYAHIPDSHEFSISLAIGVPLAAQSIKVIKPKDGEALIAVLLSREKLRAMGLQGFVISVRHAAKQQGLSSPDQSQIAALYWRACQGERINYEPLLAAQRMGKKTRTQHPAYACFFSDPLQGLVLRLVSMEPLLSVSSRQALLIELGREAEKYEGLVFQQEALEERLSAAASGIEATGLSLPVDILIGVRPGRPDQSSPFTANLALHRVAARPVLVNQPRPAQGAPQGPPLQSSKPSSGTGLLRVEVSPDKMSARIAGFKKSFYQKASLDEAWLRQELARLGITNVMADKLATAAGILKQEGDLNGLTIAAGMLGRLGSEPYLVAARLERQGAGNQAHDLRKARAPGVVKTGELVAEVAFTIAPDYGSDVYGKPLPLPTAVPYPFKISEGFELRDNLRYYALHDGIAKVDTHSLELNRAMVHVGDVNIASGDIDFDGPIVIKGSIDTGASVSSNGSITVEGGILGGYVRCRGDLIVKGGINAAQRGLIFCRGNITAEFIENASIICTGNVQVEKTILNSSLFIEGNLVVVSNRGILAGGDTYLWGELQSYNIGLPSGLDTRIHLGVNWRWARRFDTTTKRLTSLNALTEKLLKELSELKSKSATNQGAKLKESLSVYEAKVAKLERIVEHCKRNLLQFKKDRPFNPASKAVVRGKVQPRSHFFAEQRRIKVPENIQGVTILAFANDKDGMVRAIS